jgi:hypothetical protein
MRSMATPVNSQRIWQGRVSVMSIRTSGRSAGPDHNGTSKASDATPGLFGLGPRRIKVPDGRHRYDRSPGTASEPQAEAALGDQTAGMIRDAMAGPDL